jgi:hypothetical protein
MLKQLLPYCNVCITVLVRNNVSILCLRNAAVVSYKREDLEFVRSSKGEDLTNS